MDGARKRNRSCRETPDYRTVHNRTINKEYLGGLRARLRIHRAFDTAAMPDARVRSSARTFGLLTTAFIAAVSLVGCASEKIVFQNRGPFNPPPDAASGFLGYYDAATKQTTCGNCHVDFQASWKVTKHAGAYNAVTTSSVKTPACYSCHTLTGNGNAASGTVAGHDKVADSAYFDVQCESCHGAGLQHVEGVGQGTLIRPLAKLSMAGTGNCGDCHSGTHQPFVEEWRSSRHSTINASRVANAECAGCHEGRKALERWGVDVNFVEKANPTDYQPVASCAVCHDPHGSGNPSQLRFPVTSQDPDQNLCMKCHNRRSEPEIGTSSPHAPQGAMLLGFAGYRPPGFAYDTARIYGSHATTQNPKLCAGCHIAKFTVTDAATGGVHVPGDGSLDAAHSVSRRRGQADSRQDLRLHGNRQVVADLRCVGLSRQRRGGCRGVHNRPRPDEVLRRSTLG